MPLRFVLPLVLLPAFAQAQALPHGKEMQANAAGNHAVADDKLKRREELRAALRVQGDEPATPAARGISPQERAALREQLRTHATPTGVQQ